MKICVTEDATPDIILKGTNTLGIKGSTSGKESTLPICFFAMFLPIVMPRELCGSITGYMADAATKT